jgi:uncharacterized repeat protein (TIGR03803 family)
MQGLAFSLDLTGIRFRPIIRTMYWSGLLAFALCAVGMAPAQVSEVVLHNFASPPKGANPYAGVVRDPAGNLYGTTSTGGTAGWGVVYKLDAAGMQTVLHNFTGGTDGSFPVGGVILDPSGNLYGTTESGGKSGWGVVYKLNTAGQLTVLHSFTGGTDGGEPLGGVILDSAGNLYGTTLYGGTTDGGVVFMLTATGHETVLHSFTGPDGALPDSGVIRDSAGNLYGTTQFGGIDWGVVYELDTTGQLTVLYTFTDGADGGSPYAGVIRDSAGNLYGTTTSGNPSVGGSVYKLDTTGQLTVLASFPGASGAFTPYAPVTRDSAGNIYGTTFYGGAAYGFVYKLDTAGNLTMLYTFTGGADGGHPYAGVILDSSGNLYGTTFYGGPTGRGVVYKLDTAGQETVLYSFPAAADGYLPHAGLIGDAEGNLYGTTFGGGTKNGGVVFKLKGAAGPVTGMLWRR